MEGSGGRPPAVVRQTDLSASLVREWSGQTKSAFRLGGGRCSMRRLLRSGASREPVRVNRRLAWDLRDLLCLI